MELEKQLRMFKEQSAAEAKEEKISETIRKSKELFLLNEQEQSVHYCEFLLFSQQFPQSYEFHL